MGPAARAAIYPLNRHHAEVARSFHLFPQSDLVLCLVVTDLDSPVLPHKLIGPSLNRGKLAGVDRCGVDINGGTLRAKVKAQRRDSKLFLQYSGEQVLAGVLLHVIESSNPIDRTRDLPRYTAIHDMYDVLTFVLDIDH
jgi:hypothetical protein